MHSPFHSLPGYSPNRNDVLTENSGKPQRNPSPRWGRNVLMLYLVKENHVPRVLIMMKAEQPMSGTVRHSAGRTGALGECQEVTHTSTCLRRPPFLGHHPYLLGGTLGTHHMPGLLLPGK